MTDIAYHPTRLRALRDQFRALRASEFPWTADTVYLNNASIGPIPERTRRALDEFTAKRTAPHLLPDRELQAGLQAARVVVARLLNAEPAEIALATNTSHGLNLAARALPLGRGDVVLVSDREFPANVYPWMLLKKQGVEVELAPCTPEGWPDEDYLVERLHDPRVRVLAVSFVQFSNGYRADLARLGAACRANGTFLVVDGIQGVGNCVLDVRETPVDILACGGQKWLLAPWGSGFVYVRRELISVLEPAVAGWMAFEGTDDFSRLTEYNPTFRSDARRFEMVTLPFQDFYGMTASVGAGAPLGRRNRRPRRVTTRRSAPLGDRLPRSRARRRGLPRAQAGPRRVLAARRGDPTRPALLQHRRGAGAGVGCDGPGRSVIRRYDGTLYESAQLTT